MFDFTNTTLLYITKVTNMQGMSLENAILTKQICKEPKINKVSEYITF